MTPTTAELPARVAPTLAISQCATLAWRGIVRIRHNPFALADVILTPIIFLMLFVYVFGGAIAGSTEQYLQFVMPGMLGLMALFASMGIGVALNQDLHKGVFDRIRTLPTVRIAPLVGVIGSDIVRQVIAIAVLYGFGTALGFRAATPTPSVLAALVLTLAFALALSWVWVLLGLLLDSAQAVQGLGALIIFPLAFASNIFVPPETMPDWMQSIVAANPAGHLMDAVRGLLLGGPTAAPLTSTAMWMLGFVAVFAPLSLLAYRRRP